MDFSDVKINLLRTKNFLREGIAKLMQSDTMLLNFDDDELDTPLISVIIPTFMEEKILRESLKIFSKERKKIYNLEVIVSDGGSTDRTIDIAKEYADLIVRHNKLTKQTISEGRNRGASVASGDTLVFINADTIPADADYFFSYIYRWSKSCQTNNKYHAIATYVTSFPEETILKDRLFYFIHNLYVRLLNFIGFGIGRGECQIVRKDLFFDVGGYNAQIVAGEDFNLYQRLSKKTRIKFAPELIVYESPRRFRKYGYVRVVFQWVYNSLSVMFFGKSLSRNWEAVR